MAWGIGRFKATKNTVALKRPIPPGPSRWAAQHHCAAGRVPKGHPRSWPLSRPSAGNSSFQHPPRTFWRRDVDRYEYSPGRVRSLKATVFFVALRLLTLPGERYTIGQHHGAEGLVPAGRLEVSARESQVISFVWRLAGTLGLPQRLAERLHERVLGAVHGAVPGL